ncbi:MAG: F0F1 ATP synthase subunit B [Verrucomicrobiota bacterium]
MIDPFITLAAADASKSAEQEGIFEKLIQTASDLGSYFHVDGALLFAQGLNFIIVAVVLWKFAFKPVMASMEERQKKIQDGLQYAEEMKARLADAEKQSADKIKEASGEAAKLVADARENAKSFLEQQNQEAVQHAEGIIAKAHSSMEQERKQMLSEIRKEVADLVVSASAKVLDRELSAAEKSRFSESAAKELAGSN